MSLYTAIGNVIAELKQDESFYTIRERVI